ncbi:MAG: gluconeogenesis factor YvcK family protein [Patescibacteria group bacterium]
MKKITVVGGGSGIFNVLKGLKNYPVDITSIVTTFDNGGSTGLLRDEFGILPPGDIRRSLVALAPDSSDRTLRDLFNYRFRDDCSLSGHSFGNLPLQALTEITTSQVGAIKKAGEILNIKGQVLPISLDPAHLCAQLKDGTLIEGETNIDIPKHDGSIKIDKIFLKPNPVIYREAYEAIMETDLLIIGPGDLYTFILPNILVSGFNQALSLNSKAKVVYVCNIMTKWGETNGFQASDFVSVIYQYLNKRKVDYILFNTTELSENILTKYEKERSQPVVLDEPAVKQYVNNIIKADLVFQDEIIRHDAEKISRLIVELL